MPSCSLFRYPQCSLGIAIKPLNTDLNPICHLLALLGAHHIFHVSGLRVNAWCIYLCFSIFEPVYDQLQIASELLSCKRKKDLYSDPSIMNSTPTSINDLPDEVLLHILSHFGPEELSLIIAKVCLRWNVLAKDVVLWKYLSYTCDNFSDISLISEVRCSKSLGFNTN